MKKSKLIFCLIIAILLLTNLSIVQAKTNSVIHFKDKNLETALCKYYKCKAPITKERAHELSKKDSNITIDCSKISSLEGIQYFDNLVQVVITKNKLTDLKPLSKLKVLAHLDISDSYIKGQKLEAALKSMGKINHLCTFNCNNNEIEDISFLGSIGNVENYYELSMENNKIKDISILKSCIKLEYLYLINNRITDITPLPITTISNVYGYDLHIDDNCIINLEPIRPLFDKMFDGRCGGDSLTRSDFYENSVDIIYKNKELQFPYKTVYYKYQAYADAVPFIEAIGGSAIYNNVTGTLTWKYNENEYVMKDFSKEYTVNGIKKSMKYEMRRMQYDLSYIPVKDLCKIMGLNYKVLKIRTIYTGDGEESFDAPEIVEISHNEKLGSNQNYEYKITDNHISIINYRGIKPTVEVPSQIDGIMVTCIEDGAFAGNDTLDSVDIPDTVIRIGTSWGKGAFSDCSRLKKVVIHDGKEDAYIGSNSFSNCKKLSSVIIPGNYRVIYDNAFSNCTSLTSIIIPEGMVKIGAGVFDHDQSLTSVSIPSTINSIGYLTNPNIDYCYSGDVNDTGTFANCKRLTQVTIAEGKTHASIGDNTFLNCSNLESIMIPGNYQTIHLNAFDGCSHLKSFVYGKCNLCNIACQQIDESAFSECDRLENVSLTASLKSIYENAFSDCPKLKEFVIPEGVTTIGYY